ncbi:rhodanese-like domain-containing protein [Allokutzneria multivorans]|uniref:Rhodanese-like domain-containing protein n=1 Tax=Allokutzneria multivorans TaxID=1142134 RepID=A0ABP7RF33_9PSEU
MQVPTVDVTELGADVTLLDVREHDEWNAGHAPGALHIPLGELAERLSELPEDGELHVVCRMGGRSARAVAFLNQNGWDAINVAGGMQRWQAVGKPLAADSGAEPEVI